MSEARQIVNGVISALLPADRARLTHCLEPVRLYAGKTLYGAEDEVRHVFFPEGCVVSLLHLLEEGETVEAAMIGGEGVVGLPELLGGGPALYSAGVIVSGRAWRVGARALSLLFEESEPLRRTLLGYYRSLLLQTSLSGVCACRHKLFRRFCKWLLMAHDRAGVDSIRITHEQMSKIMGCRRASITESLIVLQRRGAVICRPRLLTVRDRRELEACVCECYGIMTSEYECRQAGRVPGFDAGRGFGLPRGGPTPVPAAHRLALPAPTPAPLGGKYGW